ncbi:MAG: peptide chain release factor N(5)-glutamine methyltransferase [Clostridia bacterium]
MKLETIYIAIKFEEDVLEENKEKKQKEKLPKAVRRTSIGGQAVLEGVMMKGARSIATAVRAESGEITIESKYVKSAKEKNIFFRLPFIRGVVNLCSQLFLGTGILMRSAEVYGDFAEPSKFEKKMADKYKINPMNILMAFSVVLGILLAVGLFVFLPNFLTGLLFEVPALQGAHPAFQSLFEGALMLVIFVLYILVVSLMKDIRRVFMYHGAEHKVISCYEHGLELTVENAKKMSRAHSRCGTTFMFFVIAVSILVFAFINWGLTELGWLTDNNIVNAFIKLPCKLLFLPLVAGVSYEILKLLAKSDCLFVRILRFPGMMLQKLTTKEPTDDMLEVSIAAFTTVMAMDADSAVPERKFDIKTPYAIARKKITEIAPTADDSDIDWLFCEVTGKKRSELKTLSHVTMKEFENAMVIANKMKDGLPFQYAVGNTEFYGIKLAVNQFVLIPRPETEQLCERAIAAVESETIELLHSGGEQKLPKVLDLCTGSGAIAIAVAKLSACEMTATDISANAIMVAQANAIMAGAKVKFVASDLFEKLNGEKFDLILSNPPYIPTKDIDGLERKVKDFEPRLALDGGNDGLDIYRKIAKECGDYLAENGTMLLEFGISQADSVKKIFEENNFEKIEIIKDMEGVDRIALISRR